MFLRSIVTFSCVAAFLNLQILRGEENTMSDAAKDDSSSISFTSSNLPIVVINTNGQAIPDDPKITADMGIIWNGEGVRNNVTDPFNNYSGKIGIELRGNSTQMFPKKPYAVETQDSTGANLDVSILGMPAENDWTFLASYIDRTFIRDPLAHYLSTLTGRWSSRCRFCELILNGEYEGVYIILEKIKRTKNRLNISKLTSADTSGENLTGGYIYEVDGFGGDFGDNRMIVYPKPEDVVPVQLEYIQNYDNNFRYAMALPNFADTVNGYAKWIDVNAFIDELIVQETMRNSDAYGWSAYFHKDKNQKLAAGPVWDFDQSAGNSNYPDDGVVDGWMFSNPGTNDTPFFWATLYSDTNFKSKLQSRWRALRESVFATAKIMAFIDSCAGYLNEAQQRNFVKWPVLGVFIWRETTGYQDRNTYQKEIDYMESFLSSRLEWIDTQLQYTPTAVVDSRPRPVDFSLAQNYPNPFNPSTEILYSLKSAGLVRLSVYDLLGREVAVLVNNEKETSGLHEALFTGANLPSGIYFYKLESAGESITKKMLLLK